MKKMLVTCKTCLGFGHEDIWNFVIESKFNLNEYEIKRYLLQNQTSFDFKSWTKAGNFQGAFGDYLNRTEVLSITELNSLTIIHV